MAFLSGFIGGLIGAGTVAAVIHLTSRSSNNNPAKKNEADPLGQDISALISEIEKAKEMKKSLIAKIETSEKSNDEKLRELKNVLAAVNMSIREMNKQLEETKRRLQAMETQAPQMKKKVNEHDTKLAQHEDRFTSLEKDVSLLKEQCRLINTLLLNYHAIQANCDDLKRQLETDHRRLDRVEKKVNKHDVQLHLVQAVFKTDEEKGLHLLFLERVKDDPLFRDLLPEPVCVVRRSLTTAQFERLRNRQNVLVLAKITEGWYFGVWFTRPLQRFNQKTFDPTITAFVIRSDGDVPIQTFPVRSKLKRAVFVNVVTDSDRGFFNVGVDGVGQFWIGTQRSRSFCENLSAIFEGLDDRGLTGFSGQGEDQLFRCQSVVVYELVPNEDDEDEE